LKTSAPRNTALVVALTLALGGCASTGGTVRQGPSSAGSLDSCKPAQAAVGGAVAGALIQAIRGGNVAEGAVVGAAVGAIACLAVNAQTRRTMDAQSVVGEFRRTSGAQELPADPKVLAYQTQISPSRVGPGTPVRVVSNIKVMDGSVRSVQRVEEHLVLLGPGGDELRRFPKEVASGESGGFDNSFTFSFPQVEQGNYKVVTELWLNGEKLDNNQAHIQLVMHHEGSSVERIAAR